MKINTKITNLKFSEEISDYLSKRLEKTKKFVAHVDPDSIVVDVELGRSTNHHRQGDVFKVEINFCIGGECLRAISETEDIHASIDGASDELLSELRKRKEKNKWNVRHGGERFKEMLRKFWRSQDEKNENI